MYLFTLLIFILICYGLSNMIIYSKGPFSVFEKWRNITERINPSLGELFSCMMCLPFWVGLFISLIDMFILPGISITPLNILIQVIPFNFFNIIIVIILDGVISSASTWILHNIEEFFENR